MVMKGDEPIWKLIDPLTDKPQLEQPASSPSATKLIVLSNQLRRENNLLMILVFFCQ